MCLFNTEKQSHKILGIPDEGDVYKRQGEGWLMTRITGPGKVFLSSVPSYNPKQQSM